MRTRAKAVRPALRRHLRRSGAGRHRHGGRDGPGPAWPGARVRPASRRGRRRGPSAAASHAARPGISRTPRTARPPVARRQGPDRRHQAAAAAGRTRAHACAPDRRAVATAASAVVADRRPARRGRLAGWHPVRGRRTRPARGSRGWRQCHVPRPGASAASDASPVAGSGWCRRRAGRRRWVAWQFPPPTGRPGPPGRCRGTGGNQSARASPHDARSRLAA